MKIKIYLLMLLFLINTQDANSTIYKDTEVPIIFYSKGQVVINTSMTNNGNTHFYTDNNGFAHGPTAIFERHEKQQEKKIWFDVMKIPADVHVTGDGNTLYYLDYGYQPSRIYLSKRVNSQWQEPVHQIVLQIESGNSMVSTNDNGDKILSAGGDLYQLINGKIVKLGANVNSESGEYDPFLSNIGNYLLFVREDSKGDSNIYISFKEESGWSSPNRLPEPFNSANVDGSPYVTADNKYLFVTSNRDGEKTATWQIPFLHYYNGIK